MAFLQLAASAALLLQVGAQAVDLLDPPGSPTEVYLLYSTSSLRKIDAVDSTFKIDFYTMLAWRDDRLANYSQFDIDAMWQPYPEFINCDSADVSVTMYYAIYSAADAPGWIGLTPQQRATGGYWVAGSGRKTGTFVADLQLQAFPFDQQNATLILESSVWTVEDLVWRQTPGLESGTRPTSPIGGWDDLGVRVFASDKLYIGLGETYHRLTVSQTLRRQYGYYLSRVVSNMILLAFMAFLVVFVPGDMPDRLGFVQTSFLGVVSWLFVLGSETPKVGYLTTLDSFTQLTFAAIFIQYAYFALHAAYYKHMKGSVHGQADTSRWGLPGSRRVLVPTASRGASEAERMTMPSRPVEGGSVDNPLRESGQEASQGATGSPPLSRPTAEAERVKDPHSWPTLAIPCPCSRHGVLNKIKPHRQVDMIFTSCLMLGYAVAVAVIIGGSVARTEAGIL